jgi:hypothetical protein
MREPDDNSVEMDVEEALPWVKDILSAIEAEEWERAQYLLAVRTALNADASSAFSQERSSLLDDYSRQLHLLRLSDVDSLDLVNRLQRMTFGMLIKDVVSLHLVGLRKFLNAFKDKSIKIAAALLFAAPAAIVHHFIAAQIDHAFETWLSNYLALVAFIFAYKIFEKPFERVVERRLAVIRQWGLRLEVQAAFMDAIKIQQRRDLISSLRAHLVKTY